MNENYYNEMIQSIQNLFASNIRAKEISDKCGISYTTVSELKNNKREIHKSNLEICYSLYQFAKENKLDQKYLDSENMKGNYKHIPLSLEIKQIVVSFERYDLFAYGIFKEINKSLSITKPNTLINLDISKSVFITDKERVYDTYEFGHKFNCRYGGTGPNDLLRFIQKYSKLSVQELENTIFKSSVVVYDFENDKIEGLPSIIEGNNVELYSLNGKLIITLNNYDNYNNDQIKLNDAIADIKILNQILDDCYKFDSTLDSFYYVPQEQLTDDSHFRRRSQIRFMRNNDIHIVLEYTDYEIWIPFRIYDTRNKDIYLNAELKAFYTSFGIAYNTSSKSILSPFTDKINYDEIRKLK